MFVLRLYKIDVEAMDVELFMCHIFKVCGAVMHPTDSLIRMTLLYLDAGGDR